MLHKRQPLCGHPDGERLDLRCPNGGNAGEQAAQRESAGAVKETAKSQSLRLWCISEDSVRLSGGSVRLSTMDVYRIHDVSTSFTRSEYIIFAPFLSTKISSGGMPFSTALRRMTDAYFSSNSIMQQTRFICSQAIMVEPLPPKVSITTAFSWVEFPMG